MKRIKTLTTLISASALVGAITPAITLTSCSKKNELTEYDLIVTLKDVSKEVNVGTKINRSNFIVKTLMSDMSTFKDVTDWTCDKFDSAGSYTFGTRGPVDLVIKHGDMSSTQSFTVVDPAELTTMAKVITMPRSVEEGEVYDSQTQLKVYSNGTRYETGLKFEIKSGSSVEIVNAETGVIKTSGFGETIIKVSTTTSNLEGEITINVADSYLNYMDISWNETDKTASICPTMPAAPAVENRVNDYVVPEALFKGEDQYSVTALHKSTNPANIQRITDLYIPSSVTKIESGIFTDPECRLQNLYYGGTRDNWKDAFGTSGDVGSAQTIGIWCADQLFLTFDDCVDSFSYSTSESEILCTDEVGAAFRRTYTARFNYSKLSDDSPSSFKKIIPYNSSWEKIADIDVIAIWVDGQILDNTSVGKPRWSLNEEGEIEFDFSASGTPLFDQRTNIIVEFRTSFATYNSVYLAATK